MFGNVHKLLWRFPLGSQLLNPYPLGAKLKNNDVQHFFYSPFFQDGRQNKETCIFWLVNVVKSNGLSLNVCSPDQ